MFHTTQVKKLHLSMQESSYPSNTSFNKSGLLEPETTSYYHYSHGYEVNYHEPLTDEYRRPSENSFTMNEQMETVSIEGEEGINNATRENSIECMLLSFHLKILFLT